VWFVLRRCDLLVHFHMLFSSLSLSHFQQGWFIGEVVVVAVGWVSGSCLELPAGVEEGGREGEYGIVCVYVWLRWIGFSE